MNFLLPQFVHPIVEHLEQVNFPHFEHFELAVFLQFKHFLVVNLIRILFNPYIAATDAPKLAITFSAVRKPFPAGEELGGSSVSSTINSSIFAFIIGQVSSALKPTPL
jgi:hypothetical protein